MKNPLQRPTVWLAAVLLALPVVHASALADVMNAFTMVFGHQGIASLYMSYHEIIDSILALVFFLSLSLRILGERFGKGVASVLGIMLAIAFAVFAASTGFSIVVFGPIAFLIILLVLGIFVYENVQRAIHNKLAAFCVAFVLMYTFVLMMGAALWGTWMSENAMVGSILSLIFILALGGLIWFIFQKFFSGGSGHASATSPSSAMRNNDAVRKNVDSILNQTLKERQREQQNEKVVADAQKANEALQRAISAEEILDAQNAQSMGELRTLISQLYDYAKLLRDRVKVAAAAPGFDFKASQQQIDTEVRPGLEKFVERQRADLQAIQQNMLKKEESEELQKLEAEAHKQLEKEELTEYDADRKIIESIENLDRVIKGTFDQARAVADHPPAGGFPGAVQPTMQQFGQAVTAYENYSANVAKVHQEYTGIQQSIATIKQIHQRIAELLKQRHELREDIKKQLDELPSLFNEYWATLSTVYSDLRSEEALGRLEEQGNVLREKIDAVEHASTDRARMAAEIHKHLTSLHDFEPKLKEVQHSISETVTAMERQAQTLEAAATAVIIIGELIAEHDNFAPQRAGLAPLGLKSTDLTAGKRNKNHEKAKKFVEARFDETITEIAKRAAQYKGTPEEQIFAVAEKSALDLRADLYAQWENHITSETANAESAKGSGK